eukprot:221291-Rhodomonas_salina.1
MHHPSVSPSIICAQIPEWRYPHVEEKMSYHRDQWQPPENEQQFSQHGQQDRRTLSQQIHNTQQQLAQLHNLVQSGGFQPQQPLRSGSFPQPQRLGSNPAAPTESNNPSWVTGDPQLLRLVQSAANIGVQDRWQPGAPSSTLPALSSTCALCHFVHGRKACV